VAAEEHSRPGACRALPRHLLLRHERQQAALQRQARPPGAVHGHQSRGHGPKILGTGELPDYSWVPPGTANYGEPAYVSWKDLPYGQKVEEAKKLLKEAGFGPDHPLHAQLRYNTNDNHKRIAVAIASMWKPLGVEVELYNTETKVHYNEMQHGQVEIGRAGWLADYNDPINFLSLLSTGVDMNYGRWSNPQYDALLKQGNAETDLKKRAELFKQAEQIALDEQCGDNDLLLRLSNGGFTKDHRLRG